MSGVKLTRPMRDALRVLDASGRGGVFCGTPTAGHPALVHGSVGRALEALGLACAVGHFGRARTRNMGYTITDRGREVAAALPPEPPDPDPADVHAARKAAFLASWTTDTTTA